MSLRKLTVKRCTLAHSGISKKTGREYSIYDIEALDETGTPVNVKLRSFAEQSIGELVEYDVDVRKSEYGTEYTIKRAGGGGGVAELTRRVERLELEVERLVGITDSLGRLVA
jgi:hypothetical protein